MTIIEINKKFYNVPTSWNELSAQQLLQVFDTLYSTRYTPEQQLLKLLKVLAGISYQQWFSLKAVDIEEYLYLVGFYLKQKQILQSN